MPKFRVLVKGANFLIHNHDSQKMVPSGFYVTAFVAADSPEAAKLTALDLVRESRVYAGVRNPPDNPPRIFVEEREEISQWATNRARPLTGFALYDEESPESHERENI